VSRAEWGEEPDLFCDAHANQDEPHPDVAEEELVGTEFEGMVLDDSEDQSGEQAEDEDQDFNHESDHDDHDSLKDAMSEEFGDEPEEYEHDMEIEDDEPEFEGEPAEKDELPFEATTDGETENDGQNKSEAPQEMEEGADSDSPVDSVPQKYWDILSERTNGAYTKENVDDLSTFKQILNESQWEELQNKLY
jgi:hypothetical protein